MSEFSTLITELISPILKSRGFKKVGKNDRSSTSDSAVYIRENTVFTISLMFHPADYPNIGIKVVVKDGSRVIHDRLHPPENAGTDETLRQIARQIESNRYGE